MILKKQLQMLAGTLLILSICMTAYTKERKIIPWLTFAQPPSPVARVLSPLLLNPNGFITSSNWSEHLTLHGRGVQSTAWWNVTANESAKDQAKGWAALRFIVPQNMPVQCAGVVLNLQLKQPETLIFTAYTGGKNFYHAKRVGKRLKRKLPKGQAIIVLPWSDLSVKHSKKITGLGIVRHKTGRMGIKGIDLIMPDQKAADKAIAWRKARQKHNLKVMLGWIAARGIDLRHLAKSLHGNQLETRAWTAVWLLGMGQQIQTWQHLAQVKLGRGGSATSLEQQRQTLVQQLEQGEKIKAKVKMLQAQVDPWIDQLMKQIPANQRRWFLGKDDRFHRGDGEPYRMIGPDFFRSIYAPDRPSLIWRPWDMRYLAALGFNGLRLQIRWNNLEPTRGHFNQSYLQMLLNIMREADRYGVGVSIDLHWPYPDWFIRGKPGNQPDYDQVRRTPPAHNPYQWPDALVNAWGMLAEAFRNVPNIVAFEVPTNEPNFGSGPNGLKDYPLIMDQWNQWLKKQYGSLKKLNAVWSAAAKHADRYQLQPDETWKNDSIQPLGFQQHDPVNVAAAYAENPRLWDQLKFGAWLQTNLTGRIMQAIRKSIPDAVGMMQRTIGVPFDKSPVPLDYHAISTLRGRFVLPGTHYGMGGLAAREAASFTLASYDSEQNMENKEPAFRRQIRLGLGVCPFAFFAGAGGGELFSDNAWHLKKSVAYLPGLMHWARTYWPGPAPADAVHVAIVENTRLGATTGLLVGDLPEILEKENIVVGVFEGLEIVQHPQLLQGYDLVITPSAYMNT